MSTLTGRDRSALLVVDVQNDVVAGAWRREEVVGCIAGLVGRARAAGAPVVWVQHHEEEMAIGTPGWEIVDALVPAEGEARVDKRYGDSFAETDLEPVLAGLGVGRIVLCGAQTDFCIASTMYGAVQRGYDVTLVEDGHTTDDTEFRGRPLPAEVLAAHLVRTATASSLPGIAWDAQPATAVTF